MASSYQFEAEVRNTVGTAGVRALRRQKKVPAVLYGGGEEPVLLALDHDDVVKNLEEEAVYSHVLNLKIDGQEQKAVLKDLQRHPSRPQILHLDFQRASASQILRLHVPLHFVGEDVCVGVKKGGLPMHNMVDVELACRADRLPEYIEVDLSALDMGEVVHLSDLKVPEGVEIVALGHGSEHDSVVATIQSARGPSEESEEGEGEGEEVSEGE